MECSIKFDTVKAGWSIVYIKGSKVIISKNIIFLSMNLANSADPDEMLLYATFHMGLHFLPEYPVLRVDTDTCNNSVN